MIPDSAILAIVLPPKKFKAKGDIKPRIVELAERSNTSKTVARLAEFGQL